MTEPRTAVKAEVISLSVREFLAVPGELDEQDYTRLIEAVLPGFNEYVRFALVEVLALERSSSHARTFLYGDLKDLEPDGLVAKYFETVKKIEELFSWSLSSLDDFYFAETIWCGRIAETPAQRGDQRGRPTWHYPEAQELKGRGIEPGTDTPDRADMKEAFQKYLELFGSVPEFQSPCPTYVLLIPIALNAVGHEGRIARFKLGAVFLHWASTSHLGKTDLIKVYRRVVEYWHHYFTSEAMERQLQDRAAMMEMQKRVDLVKRLEQKMILVYEQAAALMGPVTAIIGELRPAKILTESGGRLAGFFREGGGGIELNSSLRAISGQHEWHDSVAPEEYVRLCAGLVIKLLGMEGFAREPLWGFARSLITEPQAEHRAVAAAMARYLPELLVDEPDRSQVKQLFYRLKAWFKYAFDPTVTVYRGSGRTTERGMPLDLACAVLMAGGYRVEGDCNLRSSVFVVSRRPVDSAIALESVARKYQATSVRVGRLDSVASLTFNSMSHGMDGDTLVDFCEQYRDRERRQTDTGQLLAWLFGDHAPMVQTGAGGMNLWRGSEDGRHVALGYPSDVEVVVSFTGSPFTGSLS